MSFSSWFQDREYVRCRFCGVSIRKKFAHIKKKEICRSLPPYFLTTLCEWIDVYYCENHAPKWDKADSFEHYWSFQPCDEFGEPISNQSNQNAITRENKEE